MRTALDTVNSAICLERPRNYERLMNENQVKGPVNEITGKAKELAGKVTRNKQTKAKGVLQKNAGKAQAGLGDAKENLKKAKWAVVCAYLLIRDSHSTQPNQS